VNYFV